MRFETTSQQLSQEPNVQARGKTPGRSFPNIDKVLRAKILRANGIDDASLPMQWADSADVPDVRIDDLRKQNNENENAKPMTDDRSLRD